MTKKKMTFDEQLEDFWLEHYCDNHCTICGNRGVIDSRSTAITPAGYKVGRLNFCICPNGQSLRKQNANIEYWNNH